MMAAYSNQERNVTEFTRKIISEFLTILGNAVTVGVTMFVLSISELSEVGMVRIRPIYSQINLKFYTVSILNNLDFIFPVFRNIKFCLTWKFSSLEKCICSYYASSLVMRLPHFIYSFRKYRFLLLWFLFRKKVNSWWLAKALKYSYPYNIGVLISSSLLHRLAVSKRSARKLGKSLKTSLAVDENKPSIQNFKFWFTLSRYALKFSRSGCNSGSYYVCSVNF